MFLTNCLYRWAQVGQQQPVRNFMQALTWANWQQACIGPLSENELPCNAAAWVYIGSWDGCWEMLAMAHAFNELPLPMGLSWPTAACKKCHESPHIGPLSLQ